ncbi:MAG: DUF86 domain-containing protein [Tannerella sp.]|jgi:uncharacterized protein with HEPN domain|nr:DUF86 domain-containing protein [Tannerella sp.]
MQPNIKNDLLYLLGILESVGKIELYTEPCPTADVFYFYNDQLNFNASLNLIANIGELSAKISTELKNACPQIEWQKIKDFRNRIVHDYAGLDIYIVFKIIKTELPVLKEEIEKIIKDKLLSSVFDKEEVKIAQGSFVYSHVNFTKIIL